MTGLEVRIHRGAHEIGGSCVELRADGATLLLDLGRPLWAGRGEQIPLPDAVGLGEAGSLPLGLVLSHGHQDHWGLVPDLPEGIPVWVGKGAADVLRAAEFWGSGIDLHETGHLRHRERFEVGPFAITPYLADHSAFDAYSLLVEAGGRRLFYSGDVRGHGRKHRAFEWLLEDPPTPIDVMLLEGTNIRAVGTAGGDSLASEADIEDDLLATLKATSGLVVVLSSAQNLDRLVTVYRAAKRADRRLGIDLYTHEISSSTGRETIPRVGADWPLVSAYVPQRQRIKVKESKEFHRVEEIRDTRVFDETLAANPAGWVLCGAYQSQISHLLKAGLLANGAVVWSLWDGYLTQPGAKSMQHLLATAGVPLVHHHTSGHASVADLRRLIEALAPTTLVPIHTEAPERFVAEFDCPVDVHPDGTWWTVRPQRSA